MKNYIDVCIREAEEAYEVLNSQGGYVDMGGTADLVISIHLDYVLTALKGYKEALIEAKGGKRGGWLS